MPIQNNYHRQSLRIRSRDYSRDGYYFVTICARNRENLFAHLLVGAGLAPTLDSSDNDQGQSRGLPLQKEFVPTPDFSQKLILTMAGRIIEKNWHEIAKGIIKTDAFVVMPNHIHGIVIIKPHALCVGAGLAPALDCSDNDQGQPRGLPLHGEIAPALDCSDNDQGQPRGLPLHKENIPALGDIIGAFKSKCVKDYLKHVDENNLNESAKIWQRNYYEHIIRDRKELAAIRNYIKSNPANWAKDEENPLNF